MNHKTIKHIIERVQFHIINETKPLTIHAEAIFIDKIWEKVRKKALRGNVFRWYVMTPVNYEYFKVFFNTKYSKKDISKILKERYRWLLKHNQKLELHIHFNKLMNISYKEQERMIEQGIKWFEDKLGFKPKEFVSGWWQYNKDTLKILKRNNLKLILEYQYRSIHDYNFI